MPASNPTASRQMLVSREKGLWAEIDPERVRAGRFLTEAESWLAPQIAEFIATSGHRRALDPFAGERHLLRHVVDVGLVDEVHGIDIRGGANEQGDSLLHIPPFDGIIVTNPPYLARHSAKRKRVYDDVALYFDASIWSDLYQIAIEQSLRAASHVVAILPETFLYTSTFRERLVQVTVLERRHPFTETTCPTIVACFGPDDAADADVWVDDARLGTMSELDAVRNAPFRRPSGLRFNDPAGRIGLRAVDGATGDSPIAFTPGHELGYDVAGIKHSSRLMTRIGVPDELDDAEIDAICARANERLAEIRSGVGNLALSPFKGNDKLGGRRRRIDYRQAARILSEVSNGRLDERR